MRRIISLLSMAIVMAALILASALPALAATPTFTAACITPPIGLGIITNTPQNYNEINAFYRNCQDSGGTASRDITPNPGAPTE